MDLDRRVTVRLSPDQWRRLNYLEHETRRTKANILRLLLDAAVPTGHKEIELNERRLVYGQQ